MNGIKVSDDTNLSECERTKNFKLNHVFYVAKRQKRLFFVIPLQFTLT